MISKSCRRQLAGFGLTTAHILYRRPDHPWLLQSYVWQEYDTWCVAGVRHLAGISDPAGFSGILAKIAGWRAAFRRGGALGVELAGGDPVGRQHVRIALIAARLMVLAVLAKANLVIPAEVQE